MSYVYIIKKKGYNKMNSLSMIFFEYNMEIIEIERSYMKNMINLEYKGGVLNEDTEVIYEGGTI